MLSYTHIKLLLFIFSVKYNLKKKRIYAIIKSSLSKFKLFKKLHNFKIYIYISGFSNLITKRIILILKSAT